MNDLAVILLIYCVVRECFFIYSTQKLVNKIMCRNYHDFQVSENAGRIPETTPSYAVDDSEEESLDHLNVV